MQDPCKTPTPRSTPHLGQSQLVLTSHVKYAFLAGCEPFVNPVAMTVTVHMRGAHSDPVAGAGRNRSSSTSRRMIPTRSAPRAPASLSRRFSFITVLYSLCLLPKSRGTGSTVRSTSAQKNTHCHECHTSRKTSWGATRTSELRGNNQPSNPAHLHPLHSLLQPSDDLPLSQLQSIGIIVFS